MKQKLDAYAQRPLTRVKAISLCQPWASAMALGLKRNETRSWATSHRGDLVICSTKQMPQVADDLRDLLSEIMTGVELPRGFALCVVEVFDCQRITNSPDDVTEALLGDYTPGRFMWRTRNLRALKKPIPVRGWQGFFEVDLTGVELTYSDWPILPTGSKEVSPGGHY